MRDLRIVADENIPFVEAAFGRFGTVVTRPGRDITRHDVRDADILLVRSVTPVAASLLDDSNVEFVGSATTGTDHVDEAYLLERGIPFAHAPGSNAASVADYVVTCLLLLAHRRSVSLRGRTAGIIGCGEIGGRLARRLPALGMSVLCNDPPRVEAEESLRDDPEFVELDTIFKDADIVTLHVPLTETGPHATRHLVDADFLRRLNAGSWLINTSRGGVVDSSALKQALEAGDLGTSVLDVWENEPRPDTDLVRAVDIATPHIAGYAYDGKVRATSMLYRALCSHLDVVPEWNASASIPSPSKDALQCSPPDARLSEYDWLYGLARQAYDLRRDDREMREILGGSPDERGAAFVRLRREYRRRRELQRFTVPRSAVPPTLAQAVGKGLTIQAS